MLLDDEKYMQAALEEARCAFEEGEVPVGCVIVRQGKIIGRGHNRVEQTNDITAHAEIVALKDASRRIGNWRLADATAYITLEPCPMCATALIFAEIERIVFGAYNKNFGAIQTIWQFQNEPAFKNHPHITGGVMAEESEKFFKKFFEKIREK